MSPADREALVADERARRDRGDGPPPGWERLENFLRAVEPVYVLGARYHQYVEIEPTLYDTEPLFPPRLPPKDGPPA